MDASAIAARARAAAKAPYARVAHRDADGWSVRVPALPGVYAGGDTIGDAMAYLDATIEELGRIRVARRPRHPAAGRPRTARGDLGGRERGVSAA